MASAPSGTTSLVGSAVPTSRSTTFQRGSRAAPVIASSSSDPSATPSERPEPNSQATARRKIQPNHLYGLEPLDTRLRWGTLTSPSAADIRAALQRATEFGFEGLVLRQNGNWIKVKPEETHDVVITSYGEGKGRHLGRLGFINTARGTVGAGFSDTERQFLWAEAKAERLIGQVVEVSCMQFTPGGHFRHPFFVRMRPDKLANQSPLRG